ncbi:MAG: nucleotidyltransferase domain-containing protein [Deltaproteobacteria bacterium]|nr:nucleotidyltransferase domain-containing protein [Deltaproteobacteria bacterium]
MTASAAGYAKGLEALARLLQADARFAAAFAFGSVAQDRLRADSDLDVAVRYSDRRAERCAQAELATLIGHLGIAAGRDVHLVNIEAATPTLRFQVLRRGRKLFDRDPARTRRLIERTMLERFDWEYARTVMDHAMAVWAAAHAPGGGGPHHGRPRHPAGEDGDGAAPRRPHPCAPALGGGGARLRRRICATWS